jgi:hypothetical protein
VLLREWLAVADYDGTDTTSIAIILSGRIDIFPTFAAMKSHACRFRIWHMIHFYYTELTSNRGHLEKRDYSHSQNQLNFYFVLTRFSTWHGWWRQRYESLLLAALNLYDIVSLALLLHMTDTPPQKRQYQVWYKHKQLAFFL